MELVRINPETKKNTVDVFNKTNSWKELFKLYISQIAEVILANVLVNVIERICGDTKNAVFSDPETVNGMKILLAITLDFIRNSVEKLIHANQVNVACCPGSQPGYVRIN